MNTGNRAELFHRGESDKPAETFEVALPGPSCTRVVEIGEPFH